MREPTDPPGASSAEPAEPASPPRPSFSSLGLALAGEDTPPPARAAEHAPEGERTRAERAAWRLTLPLEGASVDALVDAVLALHPPTDDAARAAGLAALRAELQAILAAGHAGAIDAVDARLAATLARTDALAAAGLDAVPALRARLEATRLVLGAVRAALARPGRP
jgi:hypothetical protein